MTNFGNILDGIRDIRDRAAGDGSTREYNTARAALRLLDGFIKSGATPVLDEEPILVPVAVTVLNSDTTRRHNVEPWDDIWVTYDLSFADVFYDTIRLEPVSFKKAMHGYAPAGLDHDALIKWAVENEAALEHHRENQNWGDD